MNISELETILCARIAIRRKGHKDSLVNFSDSTVLDELFEDFPSGTEGIKFFSIGYEFENTEGKRFKVVDISVQYHGQLITGSSNYGFNTSGIGQKHDTNLTINIYVDSI